MTAYAACFPIVAIFAISSPLTNHKFQSFHIVTGERGDAFGNHASTPLVLLRTREKLLDEEWEGKQKVSAALIKINVLIMTAYAACFPIVAIFAISSPLFASSEANCAFTIGTIGIGRLNFVPISDFKWNASLIRAAGIRNS